MNDAQAANREPTTLLFQNDDVDVLAFLKVLWRERIAIVSITALGTLVAILFALWLPNVYRSEAVLVPTDSNDAGLGGLAGRFGGLAGLAGVSLPGAEASGNAQLALQILRSRAFVGQFVEVQDILVPLMAAKGWDREANALILDEEVYDASSGTWVRDVSPPYVAKPSRQEAYEKFLEHLLVSEDVESGIVTIGLEHYSPFLAKQWLDALIAALNREVRDADVARATRSIEYLRAQVETTTLSEMRTVLYELVRSHTETMMLAEANPDYVFRVIDPPVAPEEEVRPMRIVIVVVGFVTALLLGLLLAGIRGISRTSASSDGE